jgi:hypothetical protein
MYFIAHSSNIKVAGYQRLSGSSRILDDLLMFHVERLSRAAQREALRSYSKADSSFC